MNEPSKERFIIVQQGIKRYEDILFLAKLLCY